MMIGSVRMARLSEIRKELREDITADNARHAKNLTDTIGVLFRNQESLMRAEFDLLRVKIEDFPDQVKAMIKDHQESCSGPNGGTPKVITAGGRF